MARPPFCPPPIAKPGFQLAIALVLLDQLSKWMMVNQLDLPNRGSIEITSFLSWTWVENRGISWGFFADDSDLLRWFLVVATGLIAFWIAIWLKKSATKAEAMTFGLVFGGAIGNIIDRARLGYVVDFIDFNLGEWRPFLIFNLADMAISCGVVLLFLRLAFKGNKS